MQILCRALGEGHALLCNTLGVASVHGAQHTCTLEKLMVCRLGSHFLAYSRR